MSSDIDPGAETRVRAKREIDLDTQILNDNITAAINASERLHLAARKKMQALGLDAGGAVGGNGRGRVIADELSPDLIKAWAKGTVPVLKEIIADAIKPLASRLASLEASQLTDGGTWKPEKSFKPNQLATYRGAIWICLRANTDERPGTGGDAWRLMHKTIGGGRDDH